MIGPTNPNATFSSHRRGVHLSAAGTGGLPAICSCLFACSIFFKQLGAQGVNDNVWQARTTPNADDLAWINQQRRELESRVAANHAPSTHSGDDTEWLCEFMKSRDRRAKRTWNFNAAEKRVKAKLPKSYIDFVTTVGAMSFENVDARAGFTVSILPPTQLSREFSADKLENEGGTTINPFVFATTEHGDCFCFDAQKGQKEHAVFIYWHESDRFERYAASFATCIRRFVGNQ